MRGYKAFDMDLSCRGFQYEVGKTYKLYDKPVLCKKGFHFCASVSPCFNYYDRDNCRVCEVEATSIQTDGVKHVTDKITIIRELSPIEINRQVYKGYVNGCGNGATNSYCVGNHGYGDGSSIGYGNGNGQGYGHCMYGDLIGNACLWDDEYGDGDGDSCGGGDGSGNGNGNGHNIQEILNYMEEVV